VLFHGTVAKQLPSIREKGLQRCPMTNIREPAHLFFGWQLLMFVPLTPLHASEAAH
jgi:hypothetical protein